MCAVRPSDWIWDWVVVLDVSRWKWKVVRCADFWRFGGVHVDR